jgi:hypothetical protein
VLSYHAAPESGVPRQRLHNRIYLGGLGSSAIAASGGVGFPVISSSLRTAVATAADNMAVASDGALAWVQRSLTPTLTNRAIVGGWIDNEPDTQRRRGVDPGTRTSWVPTP